MPTTKITAEVRSKIVSQWVEGKTIAALAVEHNITARAISADKKTYAHIWKFRAVKSVCDALEDNIEQQERIARHLDRRADTDEEHFEFIESMRHHLLILETQLKRVGTLFKEKGKRHAEAEAQ